MEAALVTFNRDTVATTSFVKITTDQGLTMPAAEWTSFESGTNYEAGLSSAKDVLEGARSDAQKVVIFISDGEPNHDNDHLQSSITAQAGTDSAVKQVKDLQADHFYVVGVGSDKYEQYLTQVAGGATSVNDHEYYASDDADKLTKIFEGLASQIMSVDCSNVIMTDELSDYAKLTDYATFTVNITNTQGEEVNVTNSPVTLADAMSANGASVSFVSGDSKLIALTVKYDNQGKKFTLDFPDDYALENGWVYTITTQIQPTDKAYTDYAANIAQEGNNGYGSTKGDPDTDAVPHGEDSVTNYTSSEQPGFRCNSSSNLSYTSNGTNVGEDGDNPYPYPVIQVPVVVSGLVEEKSVAGSAAGEGAFTFTVTPQGDTTHTANEAAAAAGFAESGNVHDTDSGLKCAYANGVYSCESPQIEKDQTVIVHTGDAMVFTTSDAGTSYTYVYRETDMDSGWRRTSDTGIWTVVVSVDKSGSSATVSMYKGGVGDGNLYAAYTYTPGAETPSMRPGDAAEAATPESVPTVSFENAFTAVSALPLTGGDATARSIVLAGGGVLLLAGAAWLLARRRRV